MADAKSAERGQRAGDVGTQRVGQRDQRRHSAVPRQEHDRLSVACELLFTHFCKAGLLLGLWVDRTELARLARQLRELEIDAGELEANASHAHPRLVERDAATPAL